MELVGEVVGWGGLGLRVRKTREEVGKRELREREALVWEGR